jgi:protein Tex
MDHRQLVAQIAQELDLRPGQVERTIALLDEGNTVPFVARYRQEVTGSLDEEQLRTIVERTDYLRKLAERKATVRNSIDAQDKLTDELAARLAAAQTLQEVEDLYLPYRPKRRTRATMARERGLEPLAELILAHETFRGTPEEYAQAYINDEVPTVEDALAGARDIVAETVAEDADARAHLRTRLRQEGVLHSALRAEDADPGNKYAMYHDYAERLANMPHHRILAVNRGEREEALRVTLESDDEGAIAWLLRHVTRSAGRTARRDILQPHLQAAVEDGYHRLMQPALEREVRALRTEEAERHAIAVFGANLTGLLMQPPLQDRWVLGIDPGYRTGCKAALVDETGRYRTSATIYPHPPQRRWAEAKATLTALIARFAAEMAERVGDKGLVIAIGNGTASRETEALAAELIAERDGDKAPMSYVMVNEAGASIYSASRLAARELPDLDVSMRGAVSIARRLQDPLAELVKIEPRHVGVGLYQHDVDQGALSEALDTVVESAVNRVGVNVNTASPALLRYVSGLGPRTAEAVVAHRDDGGPFRRRQDLLDVRGVGAKTYQQAAGFLRIPNGEELLDNTFIHPESYAACHRLLAMLGVAAAEDRSDARDLPDQVRQGWARLQREGRTVASVARELGIGVPTLEDMLANLHRPGRDPREGLPAPILRQDVLKMEDLREGMRLKGTVRNVVDFGAFVDIGVKQDGLVHISEMADRHVRDPLDVVSVGDVVDVRILTIDHDRGRIGLSMKQE